MADRPILFSGPMVRALLDGRKTQTRRVLGLRSSPRTPNIFDGTWTDDYVLNAGNADWRARHMPFAIGDRLWVRETWARTRNVNQEDDWPGRPHLGDPNVDGECVIWAADGHWQWTDDDGGMTDRSSWRPSIFMPRWASRLTLPVIDVRPERLQDISEEDAKAEGPTQHPNWPDDLYTSWTGAFRALWDSINGHRQGCAWDDNPWVAVVTFSLHRQNIDAMAIAA